MQETIPAIGQGILAVEFLRERGDLLKILAPFEDNAAACAAEAERALGLVVEGSCEVPVGGLASVSGERVSLEGFIGLPDGTRVVRDSASGECRDARQLGSALGEKLLAAGGREILRTLARLPA